MNNKVITVKLGKAIAVEIRSQAEDFGGWHYLSKVRLDLFLDDKRYFICNEVLDTVVIDFAVAFEEIINSERQINSFFKDENIGYYYNVYLYNLWKGGHNETFNYPNIDTDISQQYSLCKGDNYALWLYVDNDSRIVFELTPSFPRLSELSDMVDSLQVFKDWLTAYVPIKRLVLERGDCEGALELMKNISDEITSG